MGRCRWKLPEFFEPGHEIICGAIGMGKSYWVLHKIIRSFSYDRPCCYIDPKGDTYYALLAFLATTEQGRALWETYRHRVLLLNPVSPSDWVLGFNAIEPMQPFPSAHPDPVALLANSIVSHIRRQSGYEIGEANRMQNIMSSAIGILVQGGHGQLTLAELPLLFVQTCQWDGRRRVAAAHNPFTARLVPEVTHYGTLSFWKDQWPNWTSDARREWVQSTEGRIFQYFFDERLLMTVCTVENSRLDFRRLVEEGYWLFVNLPYALLSDTISTLLGNLLITKIFYACMQRRPGGRQYRLILDEARFFNTGPLDVILETSRAYNLWLTLVVQSLDQMSRTREGYIDYHLKDTALSNCRYFTVFHNTADNEELAQMMFPLTGQVPIGIRANGDWERLPVAAEENEHERRFMNPKQRQMVLYDKLSGEPRIWRTPEVVMDKLSQARIDLFEAAHLQIIGKPVSEIRAEINQRQGRLRALLGQSGPTEDQGQPAPRRALPPASFGGLR